MNIYVYACYKAKFRYEAELSVPPEFLLRVNSAGLLPPNLLMDRAVGGGAWGEGARLASSEAAWGAGWRHPRSFIAGEVIYLIRMVASVNSLKYRKTSTLCFAVSKF